jgi:glycerophosphoryl diester phosphodiesterase
VSPPLTLEQRYEQARDSGRPLVGGHRGNPARHPENTLASFRSAIEAGVDIIECDVHLSADDEMVVIHDHTLQRTTNGTGRVRRHTLAELRALDAGGGERIPLLEEVVELARGRVGLAIELKLLPVRYLGIEERVVALLRERGMVEQASVISFQHGAVKRVKRLEPRLQTGVLEAVRRRRPLSILRRAAADVYSPHYRLMTPELVAEVHGAGGVVAVWTVDDKEGVEWCRRCGPDSVFTNRPEEILPLLASSGPRRRAPR